MILAAGLLLYSEEFRKRVILIKDYLLVLKIKKGDPEAWELLVERYYQTIYSYCFRRCFGQVKLAEDLTQDIFLKLIKSIDKYQFTGKFFNYLFTIAVNTCNNYYSKKKFDLTELADYLPDQQQKSSLQLISEEERSDEIQQALNQLPDIQREAIILKFYHDLKVKEIAKMTEVSVPTAQSRINQGIKKLNKLLDKEALYFE